MTAVLDFQKQLEVNSIICQLVKAGEETFDHDIARRLWDIVIVECGLKPAPRIKRTRINPSSSSGKIQGYIAGFGNMAMNDSAREIIRTNRDNEIVSGNWAVSWRQASIQHLSSAKPIKGMVILIDRKFDETREPKDRESYALLYSSSGGTLCLSRVRFRVTIRFTFLGIERVYFSREYLAFKRPSSTSSPGNISTPNGATL